MFMASSSEPNFDALDELLSQTEALDAHMRSTYPAEFQAAGLSASSVKAEPPKNKDFFAFPDADREPPRPLRSALAFEEETLPEIDEENLQAYFLRRQFEGLSPDARFERAPAPQTLSRISESPAQLADEELFLYALSKLNAGQNDEAAGAMALMDRRSGTNLLLGFLPVFTAPQNGASRRRISELAAKTLPVRGDDAQRAMVLFSQRMLIEVIDVITEAEALQEAGYRNRQEALQKAAQNVRQRLSRL